MSNKTYDVLKFLTTIFLPAASALYFGLAQIWGLPSAEEVVGTVALVVTFLGVVLRISTNSYNNSDARFDGTIDVIETKNKKTFELNLDGDPYDLDQKSQALFKVNQSGKSPVKLNSWGSPWKHGI